MKDNNWLKEFYLSLCKETYQNEEKRKYIQMFLKMMIEDELNEENECMDLDLISACIDLSLKLDRGEPSDRP